MQLAGRVSACAALLLACSIAGGAQTTQPSASSSASTSQAGKTSASTTSTARKKHHRASTAASSKSTGAASGTSAKKTAATGSRSTASSRSAASRKKKTARTRGQQKIDPDRAQEIQEALIREHYLNGDATGKWNDADEAAMRKYQGDHGWQTKTVPDSRALIKLGLGPSHDHLLNPESAMTTGPDAPHATASVSQTPRSDSSAPVSTPAATSSGESTTPATSPTPDQ